jgi:anionic cell wall polymer biosynthesis LytR-Cps2A-Psr (LCP) family protein
VLRRIVAGTISTALVAVIAVLGAAIWAEASLRRVAVFADYAGRPAGGSGTNWLLVGSDSRADLTEQQQAELATGGEVGNGRTDTILLVHVPGPFAGQPTTMVSIPRDSYVDIPGWGRDKINVAFAEGEKLKVLRESSLTLRDSWLMQTGHKRPGVKGGLPVAEAEARVTQLLKEYLD